MPVSTGSASRRVGRTDGNRAVQNSIQRDDTDDEGASLDGQSSDPVAESNARGDIVGTNADTRREEQKRKKAKHRGDEVISNPQLRDEVLRHLRPNPWKLSDLRVVLDLRCYKGVLSNVDLKECFFMRQCGFVESDFVLADWESDSMSVEEMKERVRDAQRHIGGRLSFPPCKKSLDSLETKEAIAREYWELTCVPVGVYRTAVGGAHVLRAVKAGDIEDGCVGIYLEWACGAGLDVGVIRRLAGRRGVWSIDQAVQFAASGGHDDVIDLLASEYGARVDVACLIRAAEEGHVATIDHLVEKHGVDASATDEDGRTALHRAAACGHVDVIDHLVEKHGVDVHAMDIEGRTAFDVACMYEAEQGSECADVLNQHMSARASRP